MHTKRHLDTENLYGIFRMEINLRCGLLADFIADFEVDGKNRQLAYFAANPQVTCSKTCMFGFWRMFGRLANS